MKTSLKTISFVFIILFCSMVIACERNELFMVIPDRNNPGAAITSFLFASPPATGSISGTNITVTVPLGTTITSLAPTIVHTGVTISPESGTPQDFTGTVTYTVTAADGSTQEYHVTVTIAPASAKEITSFIFDSIPATGSISGTIITVTVPFGTTITSLAPTIVHTGVGISPASGASQDFTGTVTYTVTAADSSIQEYHVTVTIAPPEYIVTFDSQGADIPANPATKTVTPPATTIDALPTPPTRSGYDFAGWNIASDGCGAEFTAGTTVAGDITVYAVWSTAGLGFTPINGNTEYSVDKGSSNTALHITIPGTWLGKKVTAIADNAFFLCSSMPGVTIPYSVTTIGAYAFSNCSALTGVTIPDSVTSLGNYAFNSCSGLVNITIPASLASVGDNAFDACGLTSVTIPDGVTVIGNFMFYNCAGLTSVTIPGTVANIGLNAFNGCNQLTSVTILDGVGSIGNSAFNACTSLASITIPDSVTSIGVSAFSGCSSLSTLTIPAGVTFIGDSAFDSCGLTSLSMERMTAPLLGSDVFLGVSGCELHIHTGTTGYFVSPWNNLAIFNSIIQDL
jgi:uncharacterized repeat protein (TIGR02543 family)